MVSRHCYEQLKRYRYENLKASFNSMFGHNAKKLLELIEAEIESRKE